MTKPAAPLQLSQALHQLAAPLAEELGPQPDPEMVRSVLKLAGTVWNALVFDQANGNHRHIDQLRRHAATETVTVSAVEELIHRKQTLFPDDTRLIGGFTFKVENGRWVLRVQETARPAKA